MEAAITLLEDTVASYEICKERWEKKIEKKPNEIDNNAVRWINFYKEKIHSLESAIAVLKDCKDSCC